MRSTLFERQFQGWEPQLRSKDERSIVSGWSGLCSNIQNPQHCDYTGRINVREWPNDQITSCLQKLLVIASCYPSSNSDLSLMADSIGRDNTNSIYQTWFIPQHRSSTVEYKKIKTNVADPMTIVGTLYTVATAAAAVSHKSLALSMSSNPLHLPFWQCPWSCLPFKGLSLS